MFADGLINEFMQANNQDTKMSLSCWPRPLPLIELQTRNIVLTQTNGFLSSNGEPFMRSCTFSCLYRTPAICYHHLGSLFHIRVGVRSPPKNKSIKGFSLTRGRILRKWSTAAGHVRTACSTTAWTPQTHRYYYLSPGI